MNRMAIRAALQSNNMFNNTTADVVQQNAWIDQAYLWVWNVRNPAGVPVRWSFHYQDQTDLAVVANDATPTMPADFGSVDRIETNLGDPLSELDPQTFDEMFAADNANGVTGIPWAYKVVNRVVTLGPVPGSTATFKWTYRRRVAHLDSGGTAVGGTFTTDTDTPFWPDHHLIVVFHAALIGHSLNSNPFASIYSALRDDALTAMRADLEAEAAPGQVWGDGRRQISSWR